MTLMGFDRFDDPYRAVERAPGANRRTRAVPFEAHRRGDQYFVLADVPGTDPADVVVRVERNVVTVPCNAGRASPGGWTSPPRRTRSRREHVPTRAKERDL